MSASVVIREFERWFLRRRNAAMPPRANLALVAEDQVELCRFGRRITDYLNSVDDPDHGGWFLIDDELIDVLGDHCPTGAWGAGAGSLGGRAGDGLFEPVFLHGGAVIVSSKFRRPELPLRRGSDVRVLLTTGEPGERRNDGLIDFDRYHAAVNTGRLPGRIVVGLVGDAVLEWSYRLETGGFPEPRSAMQ